jgi:hypothetical protein
MVSLSPNLDSLVNRFLTHHAMLLDIFFEFSGGGRLRQSCFAVPNVADIPLMWNEPEIAIWLRSILPFSESTIALAYRFKLTGQQLRFGLDADTYNLLAISGLGRGLVSDSLSRMFTTTGTPISPAEGLSVGSVYSFIREHCLVDSIILPISES